LVFSCSKKKGERRRVVGGVNIHILWVKDGREDLLVP
jgi:hypothetical protein